MWCILADSVGYGDLGPYGGGELRGFSTPRIDQLAREGLRLTQYLVEPAFLAFTHYWGRSRKGQWFVMHKTASNRQRRTLRTITLWCRENRHQPLDQQHRQLRRKLRGHYAYYGITGNSRSITSVRHQVLHIWYKWLNRRSRGDHPMTWEQFITLINGPLYVPQARIVHSRRAAKQ